VIPADSSVFDIAGWMALLVVLCGREHREFSVARAATGKGRLQETKYSQRAFKWCAEPVVSFFARTGTI